jgi:nicotinamidase-related amidase
MTSCALILIDLQVAVFGGATLPPIHEAEQLLKNAGVLLVTARARGVPVVHVQHSGAAGEALERGAPGWPIHPSLAPLAGEPVVHKRAPSAFEVTELGAELEARGMRAIAVAGIQSDACVGATCRAALALGYRVALARDAHSTWDNREHSASELIAAQNKALESAGVSLYTTRELALRFD